MERSVSLFTKFESPSSPIQKNSNIGYHGHKQKAKTEFLESTSIRKSPILIPTKINRNTVKLEPLYPNRLFNSFGNQNQENSFENGQTENANSLLSSMLHVEPYEKEKSSIPESNISSSTPRKITNENKSARASVDNKMISMSPQKDSSKRKLKMLYEVDRSTNFSQKSSMIKEIVGIDTKLNIPEINKGKISDEENLLPLIKTPKYRKNQSTLILGSVKKNTEVISPVKRHPFRHLIFSPKVSEYTFQKHLTLTLKGLNYSTKYLKGPSQEYIQSRQITLKNKQNPNLKTLLLDLDETLISSCLPKDDPDRIIQQYTDYGLQQIAIKIRPFAQEFIKKMKNYYELVVFTASSPAYAEAVVKELDPNRTIISYILDRNNCLETKNGFFIKDLRIIKNRELKNMVIVDNLVHSFGLQILNGIPILEWRNDRNDQELKYIENYLIELSLCDDIPAFNDKRLKLLDLLNIQENSQIYQQVF